MLRAIRAAFIAAPQSESAAATAVTLSRTSGRRSANRSRRAPHSRRRQRAHAARRRPASQTNGAGVEPSSTTAVTRVFRAMSSSEYHYALEHGFVGRHPSFPGRVFAGLMRRTHHLPLEHSKRNSSSSMTSYAISEGHANGYINNCFALGRYVVVESNLPPVFVALADDYLHHPCTYEALLRQYQFEENYHAEGAAKVDTIDDARYHYIVKSAEVIGIACPTDDPLVDYRPRVSESVRSVLHVHRGIRSATVDGPHFFHGASQIRPWAIQVSCPYGEPHLAEMNRGAVKRRFIPHGTRLLTMEDAKVLFPILSEQFPLMHTTELDVPCKLRYVPAHCQPGSPEMVEHCVKQVADHLTNHATFQPTAAGSPPSTRVRR